MGDKNYYKPRVDTIDLFLVKLTVFIVIMGAVQTAVTILTFTIVLIGFGFIFYLFFILIARFLVNRKKVSKPFSTQMYKFSFLYSKKTRKEVFEPIIYDWQEEYFEALNKEEIWKARWINVRYTYAFLSAMWQKSPIGDLIEFIMKVAK